jgi:ubiquinone/menaquinone biosynthesis C-methylase UbiE
MSKGIMTQAKGYVGLDYLQTVSEVLRPVKNRSYLLMQIEKEQKILDVGCGPGTDTINLAKLVGQLGQICGVDHDSEMIEKARQRAEQEEVSAWVEHKCSDSKSLPYQDNYFDASRSERVFQHLLDPQSTLGEMVRVTKKGGWIVVVDSDWGTLSINSEDVDIERRLQRLYAEKALNNGYSGRRLYRLLKMQHLVKVLVEAHAINLTDYSLARKILLLDKLEQYALEGNIVTEEELLRWRTSLEEAAANDAFYCSFNQVIAVGCK